MTYSQGLKRRVARAERQLGLSSDGEIVEYVGFNGQTVKTTRRQFEDFARWLQERIDYGQKISRTD